MKKEDLLFYKQNSLGFIYLWLSQWSHFIHFIFSLHSWKDFPFLYEDFWITPILLINRFKRGYTSKIKHRPGNSRKSASFAGLQHCTKTKVWCWGCCGWLNIGFSLSTCISPVTSFLWCGCMGYQASGPVCCLEFLLFSPVVLQNLDEWVLFS